MLDTAQRCLGLTCFLLQGAVLADELGVLSESHLSTHLGETPQTLLLL